MALFVPARSKAAHIYFTPIQRTGKSARITQMRKPDRRFTHLKELY
jgi:hypothetical protein